jgi:hypothetical protein
MHLPRRPEGIVSDFRSKVELEDSSSRRLDLVGDIRMEKFGSRKSIRIRASKSVRVDHYLSAHLKQTP